MVPVFLFYLTAHCLLCNFGVSTNFVSRIRTVHRSQFTLQRRHLPVTCELPVGIYEDEIIKNESGNLKEGEGAKQMKEKMQGIAICV